MLERDNKEMRAVYSETLIELIKNDPKIIVLEADLMSASGTKPVQQKYPENVIDVGVAEANMVAVAAGLSAYGRIPICDTFAAFLSRRDYDQVCISVAYSGLNVKLVGTDPGVAAERNGGTHMAIEDVGIMRSMPTMAVFEPCDCVQLKKALPIIVNMYGPLYMRLYRKAPYKVYDDGYAFTFGKADELREGKDVTIIASGIMVRVSLDAAELLAAKGIDAKVINMHTIKPLDVDAVLAAAKKTGAVVTAENNNYINGLGSAVAEVLMENDVFVPLERVGIKDHFGEVGTEDYLLEKFHIAPQDVVNAALNVVNRRR
jgi:transketolase